MKKSLAAMLRRTADRLDPKGRRPMFGDVHVTITGNTSRYQNAMARARRDIEGMA